jgi:2-phospho-L-lactate guanylyltransferase (CobY/MobA/RfbA family)
MEDPDDLVLAMLALLIAALLLVAGEIYLVTPPEPAESYAPATPVSEQ